MSDTEQPGGGGPERKLEPGIHTDFRAEMSYSDYLHLDDLLGAQQPVSDSHDEMLFIILHQASELWIRLMVHEVLGATRALRNGELKRTFKMLSRVSRIQSQIIQSWDVLSTLTPADYLTFRSQLGHASGFQSYQYRLLEFSLGNKSRSSLKPHEHNPEIHGRLKDVLESPSLYDEAIRVLAERGFELDPQCLERDWSQPYDANASVQAAWTEIYKDVEKYWELYELAEKLVDVEDWFQQWRFRHVQTVERVIGFKMGTGGSSGVPFLRKALEIRFFPELWDLRTEL